MWLSAKYLINTQLSKSFKNLLATRKLSAVSRPNVQFRSSLTLTLLIIAGYVGNYFNLPFFLGVDFLFGSIAVLMVLCLYGMGWGTIAAIIASIHTFFLWGHPYAAIILIWEELFVAWGLRRKRQNILLLDGFYWVFIGMPLVWLFYGKVLNIEAQTVVLVMLKQSVNGIFNALVASILLTHSPIQNWVARPQLTKTLPLQHTLFHLLVSFVFFPALTIMVLHSRSAMSNIEQSIQGELHYISTDIAVELRSWHQHSLNALTQLAEVAAHSDITASPVLQQRTELLQRTFPSIHQLFVTNAAGKVITAYPPINQTATDLTGLRMSTIIKPMNTSEVWFENDEASSPMLIRRVPITRTRHFLGNIVSKSDVRFIDPILKSFIYPQEMKITLLDRQDRVLTSTRSDLPSLTPFGQRQGRAIRRLNAHVYQWLPAGKMPNMMRWKNSFYVQKTLVSDNLPLTVVVELPTKPHFSYLQNLYIRSLALMLLITVLALILANSISRWLAKPMLQLAEVTTNLPDKLLDQKTIAWPKSRVTEMNAMVINFQLMAGLLEQKFQEIQTAKEQLEQRVKERTQELLTTNQELAAEVAERKRVAESLQKSQAQLLAQTQKLEEALHELQHTQTQLVQTEKMSSLGQLVAGVAHEINNPVNFIYGNLIYAKGYTQDLLDLVQSYQQQYPTAPPFIQEKLEELDLEFLQEDIPKLMDSMQVGAERIHEIVQLLRNFSRVDEADMKAVDIHEGIDSTLLLLKNRLKATSKHPYIEVIKEYGLLPLVECYPGQLNQVFMNILTNAIDALEEHFRPHEEENQLSSEPLPWIRIRTELLDRNWAVIRIADNGLGMTKEQSSKLFDPFFTTKPIGKGTGLGLSISYRIVVERHGGKLYCISKPKQGAEFFIQIPLQQHLTK